MMGEQSILKANPLGRLRFNQVVVDRSCIVAYPQDNISKGAWFYSIANRLLSGRILLSCTTVHATKILIQNMQDKWKNTKIGFISSTIADANAKIQKLQSIAWNVADSYNNATSSNSAVSRQLQDDISFVKAFVPRQCLSIIESLRRIAGGTGFLLESRCVELHNGGYGPMLAEGDSHLMAQLWMKNYMHLYALQRPKVARIMLQLLLANDKTGKWNALSGDIIAEFDEIATSIVY
jgi:alkylation response protein AidB-like acyl-CoA dehydrogenase